MHKASAGKSTLNADGLSRLTSCEQCEPAHTDPKLKNVKVLNKEENEKNVCRRIIMFDSNMKQEEDTSL